MRPHDVVSPQFRRSVRFRALACLALALAAAACDRSSTGSAPRGCEEGELRLRVGQAIPVTEDVPCVLAPQKGARYALAWYDPQLVHLSETVREPYLGLQTFLNVQVIEGDGSVLWPDHDRAALVRAEPLPPSDAQVLQAATPPRAVAVLGDPGPWDVGDVIRVGDPLCDDDFECRTRVARVVDGWLVIALEESTLAGDAARTLAMLDVVIPQFVRHSLPLLRETFTQERPVTGPESRQLVVMVRGNLKPAIAGRALSILYEDGTAGHMVELEMEPAIDEGFLLGLLTHEVAHTFQAEFGARTAPAGTAEARPGARWGIEGGATLMETEVLRRASGNRFGGNVDFRSPPGSPVDGALFLRAGLGNGAITAGYDAPASLLTDLADRRMRAGDDLATALREVSRGAVEGWYGQTGLPPARQGLVRRMQERIPGWTPEDAILTWTLTAAGDDVLDDAKYQNRAWLRVSDPGATSRWGWAPYRDVQGGSNHLQQHVRPSGSSGWMRLTDVGTGIRFRALAYPSAQWRLLRVE